MGATRRELDMDRDFPQPRTMAMEATIFTGWICDHLLPHAQQVKVAHPLMLRAVAAAKKKNDRIDAGKIANCLRCEFLPECHMASTQIRDRRGCVDSGRPGASACSPSVSVEELRNRVDRDFVLDVTSDGEWNSGHIDSARHIMLGDLSKHLNELPRDKEIDVIRGSGYRSSIASSILANAGFGRIINVLGGMTAWKLRGFPVVSRIS
ncbi:MAG: hypothetical protein NVSMB58_34470 [Terriglobales bacterium]